MTGYSKTDHPFSRISSTCLFDDTNFEAFGVPLHSGTRDTWVPQFEPRTISSSFKSIIDKDSWLVCRPRMQLHQGPQLIGPAGDFLLDLPWTRQILRLRQGNSTGRTFDQ